ncbi:MAG: 5'-methylthioadenosine/S-adenosylhomocysteine nucleosidase [Treponemataceae bacterium]
MIGIIGAMEEEVVLLRSSLKNMSEVSVGGFVFYQGELDGRSVVLLRCGIGKVNAGVGCALLLDRFKPSFVINTGSAGGLHPDLTFGDVVISDGLVQHDVDVTAFGYAPGQIPGMAAVFPVRLDLIERAERAVDELKARGVLAASLNHIRGTIGSGDVFVHDRALIERLRERFPGLCAVEMEGAAIAQVCVLFDVPVLVIRALSDIAGKESPMKFDEFLPLASRNSSEIVRSIIKSSE